MNTSVLFDLDGVLVDSSSVISSCINHALRANGLPEQPAKMLHRFIGPPIGVAFAELTGQPANSSIALACIASYRSRYGEVYLRDTKLVPGIQEVLLELGDSHRLAVATSKSLAFAGPLIDSLGLTDLFEVLAAPHQDSHAEDKSSTISSVLSKMETDRAVMVGDRSFDVLAAHSCSLPAIGVLWGIGDRDELVEAGADALLDSPSGLAHAIEHLLEQENSPSPGLAARRPLKAEP